MATNDDRAIGCFGFITVVLFALLLVGAAIAVVAANR